MPNAKPATQKDNWICMLIHGFGKRLNVILNANRLTGFVDDSWQMCKLHADC